MHQQLNQWNENEQDYIRFLSDQKDLQHDSKYDIQPEDITKIIYETSQLPKINFIREQKLIMKNLLTQTKQKIEKGKLKYKQLVKETNSKYAFTLDPAKQREQNLFYDFKKTLTYQTQYQKYQNQKKQNQTIDLAMLDSNLKNQKNRSISQNEQIKYTSFNNQNQLSSSKQISISQNKNLRRQMRNIPRKTYTTKHYRFHYDSILSNADINDQNLKQLQEDNNNDKCEIEDFVFEEQSEQQKEQIQNQQEEQQNKEFKSFYTVIEPKRSQYQNKNSNQDNQSQILSNDFNQDSIEIQNLNSTIKEEQDEIKELTQKSFFQTQNKYQNNSDLKKRSQSHQSKVKKIKISKNLDANQQIYNQLLKLPIKKDTKLNLQRTIDIVYLNEIDRFLNKTNEIQQQRRNAKNRKNDLIILQQQYERQSQLNLQIQKSSLHQVDSKENSSSSSSDSDSINDLEIHLNNKSNLEEMDQYYQQLKYLNRQLNQKQKDYLKDLCYNQLINDNQFQLMNQTLLNLINKKLTLINQIMRKPVPQYQKKTNQKFNIDKKTLVKESQRFLDQLTNISFKLKKYKISKNLINKCNTTLQDTNSIDQDLQNEKKDIKNNEKLILEFIQIIKQLHLMDPSVFNYILNYKVFSTTDEDLNIIYDIHKLKYEQFERKAKSCNQYFDIDKEKRRQLESKNKKKRKDYF